MAAVRARSAAASASSARALLAAKTPAAGRPDLSGDPLQLAVVFGLDPKSAIRYASSARQLLETTIGRDDSRLSRTHGGPAGHRPGDLADSTVATSPLLPPCAVAWGAAAPDRSCGRGGASRLRPPQLTRVVRLSRNFCFTACRRLPPEVVQNGYFMNAHKPVFLFGRVPNAAPEPVECRAFQVSSDRLRREAVRADGGPSAGLPEPGGVLRPY
ncbi:hypothetical protein CU254_12695 [Amycolatopsis sp. AA4]|nr:hypothetical protein CU254_12695 [Amycolatopsis sp. AA4]